MKDASIGKFILKLYVQDSLLRELRELQVPSLSVIKLFYFKITVYKK